MFRRFGSLLLSSSGLRWGGRRAALSQLAPIASPPVAPDGEAYAGLSDELLAKLTDGDLLHGECLIGGERVATVGSRRAVEVRNPATGTVVGAVSQAGHEEARAAIAAADSMFPIWKAMPAADRAKILRRWHDLIVDATEDLATIITMECGKPLLESKAEVASGAASVWWMAEECRRIAGSVLEPGGRDRHMFTVKEPVGVVAAITPWNFPLSMAARKVATALAAGCTVVLKPSELTPLSAAALGELATRAGLPSGCVNILFGHGEEIGNELLAADGVRKLSFTGSVKVGKLLAERAARSIKRVTLELGGNAPLIVFDDADVERASRDAVRSALRNAGQTCICANRIFVQDSLYDRFVESLSENARTIRIGNGLDKTVHMGPLISPERVDRVDEMVVDAVSKGALTTTGGQRAKIPGLDSGNFYEPTVLRDASIDMRCFREENFGPIIPVLKFKTDDEAVLLANKTEYGLASYFYTGDLARAWRVSNALEYGLVGVNEVAITSEAAPFGGVKQSGIGREHGREGVEEYLETKCVCMGMGYSDRGFSAPRKTEEEEMD